MERLRNIHLGEIFKEEFFKPLEILQYRLAKDIHAEEFTCKKIHEKMQKTQKNIYRHK